VSKLKASVKEAKSSANLVEHIGKSNWSSHYAGNAASKLQQPIEESTGSMYPVTVSLVNVPSNVDNCAGKTNSTIKSSNSEKESMNNTSFEDKESMLNIFKSDGFVKSVYNNTKEGGSKNADVIYVYESSPFRNKKSGYTYWSVIYGNMGEV
jgi:hypothetical protein